VSFWETAFYLFWRDESLPVLLMALGLAFVLFIFNKQARRSTINTLGIF